MQIFMMYEIIPTYSIMLIYKTKKEPYIRVEYFLE